MSSITEQNGKSGSTPDATNIVPADFEYPKWLTAEVFERLLINIEPSYHQIKNFEVKPALAAGENYCTQLVRVKIDTELTDGTTKLLSYMMKLPSKDELMSNMMEKHNIFEVEYKMYNEILPEFKKLYRDAGEEATFSVKCYNLETPSKFGAILLEDLGPVGYKNANRLEGLDFEHTKAVLERLAQWHAASAVRVDTKGLYSELFNKGIFHESQRETLADFNTSIGRKFLESIKTIDGHEKYYDSVEKTLVNLLEEMFQTANYDPNEFNVLNHGDCWCNNVMFKYDSEGKLEDTLLIDYQLCNYGTPAKDLHYFLMSSTSYDNKLKHFDYFINFYYDNLVNNLRLLKYSKNLPTLKDIHIAMFKYGIWGLTATLTIMPLVLLESNDDANGFFGHSEAAERFRNAMFANPRYRKHLEIIMPWMSNRGVFIA